jgi:hypothetical protein
MIIIVCRHCHQDADVESLVLAGMGSACHRVYNCKSDCAGMNPMQLNVADDGSFTIGMKCDFNGCQRIVDHTRESNAGIVDGVNHVGCSAHIDDVRASVALRGIASSKRKESTALQRKCGVWSLH